MKPLAISPAVIAREGGYLAACLLVALGANIYSVIAYHRPAIELLSQLGFVVVITAALYAYTLLVRALWAGCKALWRLIFRRRKATADK